MAKRARTFEGDNRKPGLQLSLLPGDYIPPFGEDLKSGVQVALGAGAISHSFGDLSFWTTFEKTNAWSDIGGGNVMSERRKVLIRGIDNNLQNLAQLYDPSREHDESVYKIMRGIRLVEKLVGRPEAQACEIVNQEIDRAAGDQDKDRIFQAVRDYDALSLLKNAIAVRRAGAEPVNEFTGTTFKNINGHAVIADLLWMSVGIVGELLDQFKSISEDKRKIPFAEQYITEMQLLFQSRINLKTPNLSPRLKGSGSQHGNYDTRLSDLRAFAWRQWHEILDGNYVVDQEEGAQMAKVVQFRAPKPKR